MKSTHLGLALLVALTVPANYAGADGNPAGTPNVVTHAASSRPQDEPKVDNATLISWVATTVADAVTFGAGDYRIKIANSAHAFTKPGWESFVLAIQQIGVLDAVTTGKYAITSEPERSPVLIQQSASNGEWRWVVTMPLRVDYTNGPAPRNDTIQLAVVVQSITTPEGHDGLSIVQFIDEDKSKTGKPPAQPNADAAALIASWPGTPIPVASSVLKNAEMLDQANMDDNDVTAWAAAAATRAGTFTFNNTERAFANAQKDFTLDGWQDFKSKLTNSGLLKNVALYQQVLTVAPTASPLVVNKGVENGRFQWTVKVNVVESVRANCLQKATYTIPTTMTIVRTPLTSSPQSIAINSWDAAEKLTVFSAPITCDTKPHIIYN